MEEKQKPLLPERLPYPTHPWLKALFKSPIWLYRMGWGPIIGRSFMILTTIGRKSGLPRHTAIEYHTYKGRKYVMNGYGMRSDWYRNILADPHVTVQTADGLERCLARPLTNDAELAEAYEFFETHPAFRLFVRMLGYNLSREEFLAQRERWGLVTFDPTGEDTPPGVDVDLKWVNTALAISFGLGWLAGRKRNR